MAEEARSSQRDETLVKVLDRLIKQIDQQSLQIEDMEKHQLEMLSAMETVRFQLNLRQDEMGERLDRTERSLMRYRSDMLGLVNVQVRIDTVVNDMAVKQAGIIKAQEEMAWDLAELDKRGALQEKTAREHMKAGARQQETLVRELENADRHMTKLHMDTEKTLTTLEKETQQRVEALRQETMRRLLAFDEVESALRILLSRTEPPPPKELPMVIRTLYRFFGQLRGRLAELFQRSARRLRRGKRSR